MNLSTSNKIIIVIVALGVSYAAGRYSAPEKIKIETKIVEVERKESQTDVQRNKRRDTTTTTVVRPDGTQETTTRTVEDTRTDRTTEVRTDTQINTDKKEEKTYEKAKTTISGMAGILPFTASGGSTPSYGAHITRNFVGPISIGAFGFTNGLLGISVGLSF